MEIKPTPPSKEIIQPVKIYGDKAKRDNHQKRGSSKEGELKEEKKEHSDKQGDKIDFFA